TVEYVRQRSGRPDPSYRTRRGHHRAPDARSRKPACRLRVTTVTARGGADSGKCADTFFTLPHDRAKRAASPVGTHATRQRGPFIQAIFYAPALLNCAGRWMVQIRAESVNFP